MNNIFTGSHLIPITLVIAQSFIILFLCISGLKRAKILSSPIAGIEYSQAILAASFLFGALTINTTVIEPVFHAFQTYCSQQGNTLKPFMTKFGQFFVIMFVFQLIYISVSWVFSKVILSGAKAGIEISSGNIPFSILLSACIIVLSISCKIMSSQFMDYITPQFVDFRYYMN